MSLYLRDIDVGADHAIVERFRGGFVGRFSGEACCVLELFLSQMPPRKLATDGIAKVLFVFTDELNEPPAEDSIKELIDVLVLPWPFDFATYVTSEPYVKKKLVLDSMTAGLHWLAEIYGWNTEPIDQAYEGCLAKDLKVAAFLKKSWLSPYERYRVRIYYTCDIDKMTLEAVLYKNRSRKVIARVPMGSDIPGSAAGLIIQGKWTKRTVFSLETSSFRLRTLQADFSEYMEMS